MVNACSQQPNLERGAGLAKHRAYKACAVLCIAFVLTVTAAILGIMLGSTNVSFSDVIAVLTGGNPSSTPVANIVKHIRLPRVEAALLAGAALATSGCIIQTVLANPLASPNVIGVNAGSGCAVLLVSSFLPGVAFVLPFAAFGGALLVALIIFAVASYTGASRMTIVLVGMAMTAICTAGMNTILIINPDAYVGASTFLVGGLAGVKIQDLVWPAMLIIPGIIIALLGTHALNIVTAGDNVAASVGMNVRAVRLGMLALAALLAGAAVSFAGMLGFVGLIIPHVVRLASGNDARFLIPTSIFLGAAFVTFCDLAARTMFAPYEIPVGILMAFVGGPFFIWLVIRKRGGNCA